MKLSNSLRVALAAVVVAAMGLVTARPATAQEASGTVRVAVANPGKILSALQESADMQKNEQAEISRLKEQEQSKGKAIQDLRGQRDKFTKKGTPDWDKQTADLVQKSVEARVWAETEQARLTRRNKDQIKSLFEKIQAAVQQIAQERKIDLVVTDFGRDMPDDVDDITPDALRQLIAQKSVLYAAKGVDLSDDVIARLNAAYKSGAGAPSGGGK
jgi:Skp family chaperone for outer membrane proteins